MMFGILCVAIHCRGFGHRVMEENLMEVLDCVVVLMCRHGNFAPMSVDTSRKKVPAIDGLA
jgi:hypothetical protein